MTASTSYTLILAAHGSADDPRCAAPVERHAATLRESGRWEAVHCIYWKQSPYFRDLAPMTSSNAIVVVPVMTASGYYASTVLPRELGLVDPERARRIRIARAIGESAHMPRLIAAQASEAWGSDLEGVHLVIVGHGTRRDPERSGATTLAHVAAMKASHRFRSVSAAFLEQEPTIADALAVLPAGEPVIVVPFLIADGSHGADDIPHLLDLPPGSRRATVDGRVIVFAHAVGERPELVDVIEQTALDVVDDDACIADGDGIGRVTLVGAGPGDPELVTVKGLRALRSADVVLYDRLAPRELLDEAPASAERIDVGKHPGRPTPSQPWINELILSHARRGKHVVRLKGGDPCVFGRGGEEAIACAEAGIPCEIVPGVTAAFAAGAAAGVPLTHRGVAASLALVTAVTDWEHPDNVPGDESQIDGIAQADTICVYMGLAELSRLARRLIELGREPSTPVIAISRATHSDQREVVSTLHAIAADVAIANLGSPVLTIIGEVVNLQGRIQPRAQASA